MSNLPDRSEVYLYIKSHPNTTVGSLIDGIRPNSTTYERYHLKIYVNQHLQRLKRDNKIYGTVNEDNHRQYFWSATTDGCY